MPDEIVNKVASSGLITIDLENFYPKGERVVFDLKPLLFQELILKEKDFREFVKQHNWENYRDKFVAITCSADAVVPTWAFMLVSISLEPFAQKIIFGSLETLESIVFHEQLQALNYGDYKDKRVVIKGCSNLPVPVNAYVELVKALRPLAKSIMYGEPCSTVPLYKASIAK
ncbi:MAG: hypothetical protein K0R26_178 [Bacteroidota bacterium]|jgi:hypothetical protein|nr:hypothetical protein [Bacteroidota bacterium]